MTSLIQSQFPIDRGVFLFPHDFYIFLFIFFSEATARIQMQNYINASAPVILYINKLFLTRELGIDW